MTVIGASIVIRGEVTSEEPVVLHGRIRGPVVVRYGTLAVSETARIDGDVRAARVVVEGTVNGPILGDQKVELGSTARVRGNMSADQVIMWDGAEFHGNIDMGRRTIAVKAAQFRERHPVP